MKNENIFIYDISYKTFLGEKPLRIRFNKSVIFIDLLLVSDRKYYLQLYLDNCA